MYYNGQIVLDLDKNIPVKVGSGDSTFAWDNIPNKSTAFTLTKEGEKVGLVGTGEYHIFLPESIDSAKRYMELGYITALDL